MNDYISNLTDINEAPDEDLLSLYKVLKQKTEDFKVDFQQNNIRGLLLS
jgi:hypothetical protein